MKLEPYAWPGGYQINYLIGDGEGYVCFDCAKKIQKTEPEVQLTPDIYYEGDICFCDECNKEIESAYGPIEGEIK